MEIGDFYRPESTGLYYILTVYIAITFEDASSNVMGVDELTVVSSARCIQGVTIFPTGKA